MRVDNLAAEPAYTVAPGVDMRVRSDTLSNLDAMAREYQGLTGKTLRVTSGYRSPQEQAALFARLPLRAAPPGRSMHEYGVAFDTDREYADQLDSMGLLAKYGFWRPLMRPNIRNKEPWHIERKGIKYDLIRAAGYLPGAATAAVLIAGAILLLFSLKR